LFSHINKLFAEADGYLHAGDDSRLTAILIICTTLSVHNLCEDVVAACIMSFSGPWQVESGHATDEMLGCRRGERERQNGERDEVELKLLRNRADQPSHRSAGAALSSSTSWPLECLLQDWYYSLVIDYNTEGLHGACLDMGSLHPLQYCYFQQPTQISHV
jgi:hypothetical protein